MNVPGVDSGEPGAQYDPTADSDAPDAVAKNPILDRYVWGPMHRRNDNWMGAFVGETGKGKSYAALRTCEVVDPDFSVDHICFGVGEFLERVATEAAPGDMTMFEEASVEADSSQYMSVANRAIRYVSETWRHQRRGVAFTLPAFGRLDSGVRGRLTNLIQLDSKNEKAGYTLARFKILQQDSMSGEIYQHYPRIDGVQHKRLKFRKPSEQLLEQYEQRKESYTKELNAGLLEEYLEKYAKDKPGDPEDGTPSEPKEIVDDILDGPGVDGYLADNYGQQYIDRDLIELDYEIGARKSKKVKKLLQQVSDVDAL
jgi:hypothetical protein